MDLCRSLAAVSQSHVKFRWRFCFLCFVSWLHVDHASSAFIFSTLKPATVVTFHSTVLKFSFSTVFHSTMWLVIFDELIAIMRAIVFWLYFPDDWEFSFFMYLLVPVCSFAKVFRSTLHILTSYLLFSIELYDFLIYFDISSRQI